MANILLAEDDSSLRQFIAGALAKAGHTVISAEDGLGALRELKARAFDLLLTDIVMPGMDGVELAVRATALHPSIRIVFITGFAAMALENKDTLTGKARLISKPFHLGALIEEVADVLGR